MDNIGIGMHTCGATTTGCRSGKLGSINSFFLCTYTANVKDYCHEEFYQRLDDISEGWGLHILDNSEDNGAYLSRIKQTVKDWAYKPSTYGLKIDKEPKRTKFLRAVADSANLLRDKFLKSNCEYFVIIESDVLPPKDLIEQFERAIAELGEEKWGAIGGLYYKGFHNYELEGLQKTHHCLSGCTLYRREALEKYPFRWSMDNLGAFSDAWWSNDSGQEYSLWNDHRIVCEHVHASNGTRYSRPF